MVWVKKHWGKLLFLFCLVAFAYFNSLNNEFVSDDIFAIVNNQNLGDFGAVLANPFYFLRPLEYWIVFNLFGKNPLYFRLINVVFHLFAVWGVYALVGLLNDFFRHSGKWSLRNAPRIDSGQARMTRINKRSIVAFTAAMIFAVHPLGVEAVSWISAGGYVQAGALIVWSMVFFLLAIRYSGKHYIWSLVFLLLALFSTERAVVAVGLMFMLTWLLGKLKTWWKYLLIPAGLSLIWIGVSVLGISARTESLQVNYYNDPGKVNFLMQLPVAISEYLKLFVWPVGLTLYHSDLVFSGFGFALRVVVLLGFLAGIIWTAIKNKRVFFWLSWFVIGLSPTLLPLGLSWIVAERYVYLSLVGLVAVTAMGFDYLKRRLGADAMNLILVLLIGGLMLRTILRNNDWQTADDLWFSAERYSILSPQNHNNLGDTYGGRGDLERSKWHFERAIELNPRYADAMHNLGNVYLKMGEIDKAKESFRRALENNPNLWQSEQMLEKIKSHLRGVIGK